MPNPPTNHALTPAEIERIHILRDDGVPITLIAEDLDRSVTTVHTHAPRGPKYAEMSMEWRRVWPQIRKNPILLDLHHQIFPK